MKRLAIAATTVVAILMIAAPAAQGYTKSCVLWQYRNMPDGVYCQAKSTNTAFYSSYSSTTWKTYYDDFLIQKTAGGSGYNVTAWFVHFDIWNGTTRKLIKTWSCYETSLPDTDYWSGTVKTTKGKTKYEWHFHCLFNHLEGNPYPYDTWKTGAF